MSKVDLPAAIEAAELHVQAADGQVEYAARRLRQGWTRKRRPVANVAKVALPLLGLLWLLKKKPSRQPPKRDGLYYMGAMQPVKTNFVMGLLATAVATRALWVPVLGAALAEMQRRRALNQDMGHRDMGRTAEERADALRSSGRDTSRPATPAYGYPGTAGTANVGSDPRVEAGYH